MKMENCRVIELPEIISVETSFLKPNQVSGYQNHCLFDLMDGSVKRSQPELASSQLTPVQTMVINPPSLPPLPVPVPMQIPATVPQLPIVPTIRDMHAQYPTNTGIPVPLPCPPLQSFMPSLTSTQINPAVYRPPIVNQRQSMRYTAPSFPPVLKDCYVQASPLSVNMGTQCLLNQPLTRHRAMQTDKRCLVSIGVQCAIDEYELSEPEIESDPIGVEENEKLMFEIYVNSNSATYIDNWSECLICGEVCKFRSELNHHMALHYGPSVLCHNCGRNFEHHTLYAGHRCKGKKASSSEAISVKYNSRVLCHHAGCPVIRAPSRRYTALTLQNRRRLVQICAHSSCNKSKKKRWFKRRISGILQKINYRKAALDIVEM